LKEPPKFVECQPECSKFRLSGAVERVNIIYYVHEGILYRSTPLFIMYGVDRRPLIGVIDISVAIVSDIASKGCCCKG